MPDIQISVDPARLDLNWICGSIQSSYWGGYLKRESIVSAFKNSLVFAAYDGSVQIGMVRCITDKAIASLISDVFVEQSYRGRGIGSVLMTAAVSHHDIASTICLLQAREAAQLWYASHWGFRLVSRDAGIMQRMPA